VQLKKSFGSIVAVVILVVGIVFSPFVLGQLITSDGSLETVPLIVSSIISAFLIAVGIALLVRRRMALIWVLMLSITPLFFAGVEAAMWVQFQIWSQDRNQIDLRSQEIMRKASASGTFPYLDGIALQRPYESDLYNINSSGFRTPEFSKPAPGEFRIAVLGGSTTFGLLNADKNTIPAFLEQNLRAQLARNITVWNLGVPGVTSPEELVILKHVYEAVAPDLIIAYHGGNDFGRACSAIKGRTDRSLVLKDTIQNRIYVVLDELGTVALIRLLSSALLAPDGPDPSQADVAARIQSAVDAFDQTMAGFAAFCSVQNALCRYYLQPILTTREPRTFFEKKVLAERRWRFPGYGRLYRAYLEKIKTGPNADHIDISDVLDDAPGQQFLDIIHTTTRANQTIADTIAANLLQDTTFLQKTSNATKLP
jgi:hypothetical protein